MRMEATIDILKELNVFPAGDDELCEVYSSSALNSGISLLDYMTIRDLMEFSGKKNDPALVAILICMFAALKEGSLRITLNNQGLTKRLGRFMDKGAAKKLAQRFLKEYENNGYSELTASSETGEYKPLVKQRYNENDRLYFQKYFVREDSLKRSLKALLDIKPIVGKEAPQPAALLKETLEQCPVLLKSGKPFRFDKKQIEAVEKAITQNFLIISGGPGTGKTTILANILRCLVRRGIKPERIILAAPTGRAAQRMTESIQSCLGSIKEPEEHDKQLKPIESGTIHRLLKYESVKNSFYFNEYNQLPADVVIVDEVSMVDITLMDKLIKSIDTANAKVILLGDKDQLPSVEAGAPLADLIPVDNKNPHLQERVVTLDKDYRAKGAILGLIRDIKNREGEDKVRWPEPVHINDAFQMKAGGCCLIDKPNRAELIDMITSWVDHFYRRPAGAGRKTYIDLINKACQCSLEDLSAGRGKKILDPLFSCLDNAKILTLIREGDYGCAGINRAAGGYLRRDVDKKGTGALFAGEPILILRNDYKLGLFNGDIGATLRDCKGSYCAVFRKSGNYAAYPIETIPAHESAFAVTVHKSQGSEFNNVMLMLPDDDKHSLLTREIIYTGLTRAKNRAFICGNIAALDYAVGRKIERESGLGEWAGFGDL